MVAMDQAKNALDLIHAIAARAQIWDDPKEKDQAFADIVSVARYGFDVLSDADKKKYYAAL